MKQVAFLCFCLLLHQYHLLQRQDTGAGNQLYSFVLNQIIVMPLLVENRFVSVYNPTYPLEIYLFQLYLYLNIHHHQYPGPRKLQSKHFHFYFFVPHLNKTSLPYYLPLFNFNLLQPSLQNRIFIGWVMLVAHLNHHILLVTLKLI